MKDLDDVGTKRQRIYDDKTSADDQNALALRYLDEGRAGEALEFLERTRDRDTMQRVRAWAVARGEAFILTQTERFLVDEAPRDDWRAVADKAFAEGRWHHAKLAFERIGDEERAERAAANIAEPPPPGLARRLKLKAERDG